MAGWVDSNFALRRARDAGARGPGKWGGQLAGQRRLNVKRCGKGRACLRDALLRRGSRESFDSTRPSNNLA
jgi:hypothetical protein